MPAASKKPGSTSARAAVKGAVFRRRLEAVDVEATRARGADRVQVQVADGADRLDPGQFPEAVEEAPVRRFRKRLG